MRGTSAGCRDPAAAWSSKPALVRVRSWRLYVLVLSFMSISLLLILLSSCAFFLFRLARAANLFFSISRLFEASMRRATGTIGAAGSEAAPQAQRVLLAAVHTSYVYIDACRTIVTNSTQHQHAHYYYYCDYHYHYCYCYMSSTDHL